MITVPRIDRLSKSTVAVVAASVFVLGYVLALLAVPAVPVSDPLGEFTAIPRLELWFLYLASLDAFWEQWTAFGEASLQGRGVHFLGAAIWLGLCYAIGRPIAQRHPSERTQSWSISVPLAIAFGSAVATGCVVLNGLTFGTQSAWGSALWILGAWSALTFAVPRVSHCVDCKSDQPAPTQHGLDHDISLQHSWCRRLIGMSALGMGWVAIITLLGACLPSYDIDVRENHMLAVKTFFMNDSLAAVEDHAAANAPQGAWMPALFWMPWLVSQPSYPLPPEQLGRMLDAVLIGQAIDAGLWIATAVLLLGILSKRFGALAAFVVVFALIAHPGMHELVRLGSGAGGASLFLVSAVTLLTESPLDRTSCVRLVCIASGALGMGYGIGFLVGAPLLLVACYATWCPYPAQQVRTPRAIQLWCIGLLIAILIGGSYWLVRNAVAFSNPIYPWGRAGEGGHVPNSPTNALQEIGDTLLRMVFDSLAHGLILIPLAILGAIAARDRTNRMVIGFVCVGGAMWWLFTTRMDRDWVWGTAVLAWPAASGVAWLQRHRQRWLLMGVGWISLSWSVVVLAAWPTCDNRLLVPITQLAPIATQQSGDVTLSAAAEQGRGPITAPAYIAWLNDYWLNSPNLAERHSEILMVGTADTFRCVMPTRSVGLRDRGLWEELVDACETELRNPRLQTENPIPRLADCSRILQRERVSHLLLDWGALRGRDEALGLQREARYRDTLNQLQSGGVVQQVPWGFLSSDAELFEILDRDNMDAYTRSSATTAKQ